VKQLGGEILALSMDEVEDSKELVEAQHLPFRILSAREIPVLADYGLEHEGGGPEGETIAVPAQLLVAQDGRIVWQHVARRITDRAAPEETLAAFHRLAPPPPR
jgi:peroxiredoxin